MTSYREQTLQKLVKTKIEIHEKVTAGEKLPETMIHYTLDADHLVIAAKPLKALEENALITNRANVCVFDNFTAGTLKTIKHWLNYPNLTFIKGPRASQTCPENPFLDDTLYC